MVTIEKVTQIECSVEDLFEFHTDSNNIKLITPPNIKVELLNDDNRTYEGKLVKIKTKKFFIPTYWEVKIEKMTHPTTLVDIAVKSPFNFWRHQHLFCQKNSKSELRDIIEFELPYGILGKLLEGVIRRDIESMFEYRHIATKKILEKTI